VFSAAAAGGLPATSGLARAQLGGINQARALGTSSLLAQLAQMDQATRERALMQLAGLPPDTSGGIGGVSGVASAIGQAAPVALELFQQSQFDPRQQFADFMDLFGLGTGLPDAGIDPGGELG
jgi:hypothetical protein